MEKIKVITLQPGGQPAMAEIENDLSSLQKFVGGYIEIVPVHESGLLAVCNEEGKMLQLPQTCYVPYLRDMLCGPVLFCRSSEEELGPVRDRDFVQLQQWIVLPQRRGRYE